MNVSSAITFLLLYYVNMYLGTQMPGLIKSYGDFMVAPILTLKILKRLKLTHDPNLVSFLTSHHSYQSLSTALPVHSNVVGVISGLGQMQN